MPQSSQAIICPICGKTDDIRKISTIVTQGTSPYSRSNYQITAQNLLTHYLQPPSPPRLKSSGVISWSFILALLLLVCILSVIGFIALGVLIGWVDGSTTSSLLIGVVDTYPVELIFRMLLGMEIMVILALLLHAYRGAIRKAKQASLQQENNERHGRWKQAMDRWNNMYYCYRDDVVFLPGHSQKYAQPAYMSTLLYVISDVRDEKMVITFL